MTGRERRLEPVAAGTHAAHGVHEQAADRESVTRGHADMLRQWMWRDFANITLGVWLLASAATLGYTELAMIWNDLSSGALIVLLALPPKRSVMRPRRMLRTITATPTMTLFQCDQSDAELQLIDADPHDPFDFLPAH